MNRFQNVTGRLLTAAQVKANCAGVGSLSFLCQETLTESTEASVTVTLTLLVCGSDISVSLPAEAPEGFLKYVVRDTVSGLATVSVPGLNPIFLTADHTGVCLVFANGQWQLLGGSFAFDPAGAILYYVGPVGLDTNDGLTPATALATIQEGLRRLGNVVSPVGTVQLLPGTFNLAANSSLNFFPASSTIGKLIIRGSRSVVATPTVTALGSHGPISLWLEVTVSPPLTPSTLSRHFATFDEDDIPFIILDNDATTVQFVGRNFDVVLGYKTILGKSFCVYTLNSKITWPNASKISLVTGNHTNLVFQDVNIEGPPGGEWANPDSTTPLVVYQTCDMTTATTFGGAYRNSMQLLATLGRGTVLNPRFTAPGSFQCVDLRRSYIAEVAFQVPRSCVLEGSYFQDLAFGIEVDGGDFRFNNCWINGNDTIAGIRLETGATGSISFTRVENCTGHGISCDAGVSCWIGDCTIDSSTSDGLRIEKACIVRPIRLVITNSGANAMSVLSGSHVSAQSLSGSPNTGLAVSVRQGSRAVLRGSTALSGTAGDVEVGLAGTKSWASILAGAPADTSDSTLNPTENVFVWGD